MTEELTQILEAVKNSIRGLYIQQLEIRTLYIFVVIFEKKMAKSLANVSK